MKAKSVLGCLVLAALFTAVPLAGTSASGPSVRLTPDRTEASLEDVITLKVAVNDSGGSSPVIRGIENFKVTAGGTSSRIEIVNFKKSVSVDYLYYIQARVPGTFTIGPAEVRFGQQVLGSNTAVITVRETSGRQDQQIRAEAPVFLKAALSGSEVYSGEPLILSLKLYRRCKVSDVSLDIPDVPGLTYKKLGEPFEYETTIEGQPFEVLELRYEIAPASKGSYHIPSPSMRMMVYGQEDGMSPFSSQFFRYSTPRPRTVRAAPLKFAVRPLPMEGRPADFSSLVGRYTMDARIDRNVLAAGETATLTLVIEGTGNVSRIPDIDMPEVPGLKAYADQPVLKTEPSPEGFTGTKTMKWAFVPFKEGSYEIPSLSLSFFDTGEKAYRRIKTPVHRITAAPGTQAQTPAASPAASPAAQTGLESKPKREVKEVGRDILPVHTGLEALKGGLHAMPSPAVLWVLLAFPPFVYLGAVLAVRLRHPSGRQKELMRSRGALKRFIRSCPADTVTAEGLLNACREYFNNRFGGVLGTLTPADAADILDRSGVEAPLKDRCVALLEELNTAIYTGKANSVFARTSEVISLVREIDGQGR